METKLVKTVKDNYILVDPTKEFYGEGYVLGTTVVSDAPRLSLKNCQAIELGYDLDELSKTTFPSLENCGVYLWMSETDRNRQRSAFIKGFKQALEILGDKKFSDVNMEDAYYFGSKKLREEYLDFIKTFQKNEWDVEVEMDMILVGQCDCPCHSDGSTIMHFMACCHPKMVESPKLDADGCLILKRK